MGISPTRGTQFLDEGDSGSAVVSGFSLASSEMMDARTKPALEEFGVVLIERGSPALGSAIEAVRADIEWLIDRAYSEAAGES